MLTFLNYLLSWLLENVSTSPTITWVLGDPGASQPEALPMGYVVPLFDTVKPLSAGVDTDTYAIPILIVDDVAAYGPAVPNDQAPGTNVQPGYIKLMQYGETIRDALRAGGAAITFNGVAATSNVPAINYVWIQIDGKPYRGARIALQVQQRRARSAD